VPHRHPRPHGDWPVKPKLPLIPGHEGVGIVTALGPGVTELAEGDRVAIPWLGWACGACEYCASGWETLCPRQQRTGYSVDGSYADHVKASARYVARVPNGMDPFEAAPRQGVPCGGSCCFPPMVLSVAGPTTLIALRRLEDARGAELEEVPEVIRFLMERSSSPTGY
jgi:alcohol dehydrogenase, propanol-preferring